MYEKGALTLLALKKNKQTSIHRKSFKNKQVIEFRRQKLFLALNFICFILIENHCILKDLKSDLDQLLYIIIEENEA